VRNVTDHTRHTYGAASGQSGATDQYQTSNFKFQLHPSRPLTRLTLYTYQPSRVVLIMYLAFVACRSRIGLRSGAPEGLLSSWRGGDRRAAAGILLFTHPAPKPARFRPSRFARCWRSGQVRHLAGDARYLRSRAAEMRSRLQRAGPALFVGAGAVLFVLGLLVCFARWRRPPYAFVLIWLIVTLLPNMLTAPAPFFYRAIAAQTAVAAMPAIGTVAIGDFVNRRGRRATQRAMKFRALRPG
jgi:hypothetical protein